MVKTRPCISFWMTISSEIQCGTAWRKQLSLYVIMTTISLQTCRSGLICLQTSATSRISTGLGLWVPIGRYVAIRLFQLRVGAIETLFHIVLKAYLKEAFWQYAELDIVIAAQPKDCFTLPFGS